MANVRDPAIVQALTALAGALSPLAQAATAKEGGITSSSLLSPPGSQPANTTGGPSGSESGSAALDILPSYLKRKFRHSQSGGNRSRQKKPNSEKTWDRDIVCIPKSRCNKADGNSFSYPRGRYRAELGRQGLVGKLHITSTMTEEQVEAEIRSVFKEPMRSDPSFPFSYLQSTGAGSKLLTVPSVSSTFRWTAQQVARLATQKGAIYILAEAQLKISATLSDSSDLEEEGEGVKSPHQQSFQSRNTLSRDDPQSHARQTRANTAPQDDPQSHARQTQSDLYSQYVDLIDLTCEEDGEDTDIDIDDLPPLMISSTQRKNDVPCDTIKLKHIVQQHQRYVITAKDEEDFQRIHVRRSCLFRDAYQQFAKLSFQETKMLKVIFVGEQAVDKGGPRREFFRLLMNEIFTKSSLFSGAPDHVVPLHSVEAVTSCKFMVVGKMLATCLIQGGQAPSCFAQAVADFLVYDCIRSCVCLEDIADYEVRSHLQKIASVTSTEELRSLMTSTSCST